MKDGVGFVLSFLGVVVLFCFVALMLTAFSGCGAGEDDQQETSSSESNVDIVDCSGATFEVPSLEEAAELAEAAGEDERVVIEEVSNDGGLDQQTPLGRIFKVVIIPVGCGNTVVNEDNDVNTAVDLSGSEESEAL